eukprot:980933-Pyramimonas_sp.AAC.1
MAAGAALRGHALLQDWHARAREGRAARASRIACFAAPRHRSTVLVPQPARAICGAARAPFAPGHGEASSAPC